MHIEWSQLNWVDGTILGIIALSVIISFFRGFLREFISLVTWLIAIILAIKYALPLSHQFKHYVHSESAAYILAFACIFVAVLVVGVVVNGIVHSTFGDRHNIGFMDRLMGIIFGGFRGILVVALLLMFVQLSALQRADWYKQSQLSPHFLSLSNWLHEFLPKHVEEISKWMD